MNMKKAVFLILALSLQLFTHNTARAADFEVSIAIYKNGIYVKPLDRKIVVKERPLPFHVVIKNTSSSSKQLFGVRNRSGQIYREGTALDQDFVALEVKPENGSRILIKKKSDPSSKSSVSPYKLVKAGKSEIIKILIDPDEWEGMSEFNRKGIKKFKIRAVYKNGPNTLYSPYYDVTFE
jgi:hypothetical protein